MEDIEKWDWRKDIQKLHEKIDRIENLFHEMQQMFEEIKYHPNSPHVKNVVAKEWKLHCILNDKKG